MESTVRIYGKSASVHTLYFQALHDDTAFVLFLQAMGDFVRIHSFTLPIQTDDKYTGIVGIQFGDELMPR